jgi:hypothetical protein
MMNREQQIPQTPTSKISVRMVLALLAIALCCAPSLLLAQTAPAVTASTADQLWGKSVGATAISPDGSRFAITNNPAGGISLKNRKTGEERPIASVAKLHRFLGNVVFSPDGSRLLFETLTGNGKVDHLYSVNIDGSNLLRFPLDGYRIDGPAQYSPDGSKVLITVDNFQKTLAQPSANEPAAEPVYTYTGNAYLVVISADGQNPQSLMEYDPSSPKFWSEDGSAIYYEKGLYEAEGPHLNCPQGGPCGEMWRYDLQTKQSTPTQVSKVKILGKVPGTDALFVLDHKSDGTAIVNVATYDGVAPSVDAQGAAQKIPAQNEDNRQIKAITHVGGGQLLITYENTSLSSDYRPDHAKLMAWQSQ